MHAAPPPPNHALLRMGRLCCAPTCACEPPAKHANSRVGSMGPCPRGVTSRHARMLSHRRRSGTPMIGGCMVMRMWQRLWAVGVPSSRRRGCKRKNAFVPGHLGKSTQKAFTSKRTQNPGGCLSLVPPCLLPFCRATRGGTKPAASRSGPPLLSGADSSCWPRPAKMSKVRLGGGKGEAKDLGARRRWGRTDRPTAPPAPWGPAFPDALPTRAPLPTRSPRTTRLTTRTARRTGANAK